MTFEELMGASLGFAETSRDLLSRATQAMLTGDPHIGAYLSMASSYAMLSESYARLASAQIVNGTSMSRMVLDMSNMPPQGQTS